MVGFPCMIGWIEAGNVMWMMYDTLVFHFMKLGDWPGRCICIGDKAFMKCDVFDSLLENYENSMIVLLIGESDQCKEKCS